jgi:peptidoglycan/xylan/chitin deacetylase (PgdA/CDA1 family)
MSESQTFYDYTPIVERKPYTWPGDKSLALYIGINIEHYYFLTGGGMDPHNRGGPPTHRNFSWRDYGNRVGVWRIFELLDELKLPASILLNSMVCDKYPQIMQRIKARGDDVLGHGVTNSQISRGLPEADEARLIKEATDKIEAATGVRPKGWLGPGATSTGVTPHLLKECGYSYVVDWPCDDQPFWMRTRAGPLLSVPYPMELNDAGAQVLRDHTPLEFADMIVDQFEEMLAQSQRQPLVFGLALHGYIIGQPYRIRRLRTALQHCMQPKFRERLWITQAGGIAEYCMSLPPGVIPGS